MIYHVEKAFDTTEVPTNPAAAYCIKVEDVMYCERVILQNLIILKSLENTPIGNELLLRCLLLNIAAYTVA